MKKLKILSLIIALMVLVSACSQSQPAQNKAAEPHPYAKTQKLVNPAVFEAVNLEGFQPTDIVFSPDGNTFYVTYTNAKDNSSQIYTSTYKNGSWSKPEKASFSNRDYSATPFVTQDGKRIYFSSSSSDGKSSDIYFVDKTADSWSEPKALGTEINTQLNESAPIIDKDGNLIFNREEVRQNDYPLADMMFAKAENNTFKEPVKLNKNIDNGIPTYSMWLSPKGDYAIFSSPREGSFDLYVSYIENGDYTYPEKLNIRVNTNNLDEVSPVISPDGNYLFYASRTSYQETMDFSKWTYKIFQVDLNAVGIKTPEERKATLSSLPDPYKDQTFPEVSRSKTLTSDKRDVYYEIFVRSFADSDGNGIGDLNGITQNLDYIQDLGATAIWLMPINRSPSYHGYDVIDYYSINPDYGTIDDFKKLVSEAKNRNIDIIMDLVVNHSSNRNPWFIESSTLKDGPYRYFYKWIGAGQEGYNLSDTSPWGSQVWQKSGPNFYYGIFNGAMPDLNYDSPDVRTEVKKIAQYWMKMGVRGFRLDAALHIYGDGEAYNASQKDASKLNVSWWKEFAKACEEVNPDAYIIGEVWEKPEIMAPYYAAFDSTFDFSIGTDVISMLTSGANIDGGFAEKLDSIYKTYKTVDQNIIDAPFLSNHDQNRIMSSLENDIPKAKLASDIYLTLPGNPFIYYGEEIGMVGTKPDEVIREPFQWSKGDDSRTTKWEKIKANTDTVPYDVQIKDPNSLLSHYKEVIALRKSTPALMEGDFAPVKIDNSSVIAYSRFIEGKGGTCFVFHNVSNTSQTLTISSVDITNTKILYSSDKASSAKGTTLTLEPLSTIILITP